MTNNEKWCYDIYQEILNNPDKKIVLVGGASSSGKSFSSDLLSNYLISKGIKSQVLSADNYYKGISRTIVEKALINNNLTQEYNLKELTPIIRKHIEFSPFPEKFSDKNYANIKNDLQQIYGTKIADTVTNFIKQEFGKINFDEPFAIDFVNLAKDVNTLINDKDGSIIKPLYTFQTGEVDLLKTNTINSNSSDIFIIEGLYALRPELLNSIDNNKIIKCAVNCDLKTLLSRKLNRDIKSGRSTLTPEQTIMSFLVQVMPSYYEYIYPTLTSAKFVLNSSLTNDEINKKEVSEQIKFKLTKEQFENIKKLGLNELYHKQQVDYYFDEKMGTDSNSIIVRVREIDKKASKLTFKINKSLDTILTRNIEEYDLKKVLSDQNSDINFFVDKLYNSGFKLNCLINKDRQIFSYKDITFKLDNVDGLGYFAEFTDLNNASTLELIKDLNLHDVVNNAYFYLSQNKSISEGNDEVEYKFLINKLPSECENPTIITQTYFDFNKHKDLLCKLLNITSLDDVDTGRIRVKEQNGIKKIVLTLKTKGLLERKEYESIITEPIAKILLKSNVLSTVKKNRYIVNNSNYKFEFDEYFGNLEPLKTVEVEISKTNENTKKMQIIDILEHHFNLNIKDITNDKRYKNNNLVSEFGKSKD